MAYCTNCKRNHNVGFVSTRIAGTDGVSLETAKWADVFEAVGFSSYYLPGNLIDHRKDHFWLKKPIFSIRMLEMYLVIALAPGCEGALLPKRSMS